MRVAVLALLVLALAVEGCGGNGVTREEKDALKERAGELAFAKAYMEAKARLLKEGFAEERAELLAKEAGETARDLARDTAERVIPEKKPDSGGSFDWGKLLYLALNVGLAFAGKERL